MLIMQSCSAVKATTGLGVSLAVLSGVFVLASCRGGVSEQSGVTEESGITVSAYATPTMVAYGGTAVIRWTSTGASSCAATPAGKIAMGSATGTEGSFTTVALTSATTFTITCNGSTEQRVTVSVGSTPIVNAAQCTPFPPQSGTTYYYCDCGTGASADCQAGDDGNAGTSTSPRQTIENAMTRFGSMGANDTVALCQGGAFNAKAGLSIGSNRCGAGVACNDLKDYTPAWLTGPVKPKPIINSAAGSADLFTIAYAQGGVRFLNLSLKGNNTNRGFFIYNAAHDLTVCNTDLDGFAIAIESTSGPLGNPKNIVITGSNISNSSNIAFLGGGDGVEISYNNWEGNGSNAALQHAIYLSGVSPSNVTLIGNNVHGQYGSTCLGGPFMSHGSFDSLLVKDNTISIDASAATSGCWGLSYGNNSATTHPVYFRNTVFSGNTIINGGNLGMTVSSCPGCIIENNVIVQNWSGGTTGLKITTYPYNYVAGRTDDVSNANTIRNNTVWFGPNVTGTTVGITTNTEGTHHIISNNTVSSAQASGTLNCFRHDLPLASYDFVNNNHCYGTGAFNFEYTWHTLAAWQTHSGGFDSASVTGDPQFTAPGTNFKPVGGPLVGAGSGASTGAVSHMSATDITGAARPTPPAIGAYEP
jgi:hypothetical protein